MAFEDELNNMEKGLDGESPNTEAPGTEAPGTSAPGTEAPGTEAPGTEAPATNAPATEAPTTEVPDDREEELRRLRAENELLKSEKGKGPKTSAPTTEAPLSLEEVQFLGEDVDLDDLMRDPKEFNKLLNKVYQQGVTTGRKVIGEGTLRQIPDIVKYNIAQVTAMKKVSEDFYSENEDLKPWSKNVAAVYEELASEHPDWDVKKTMEETGKETRKRLNLQRQANDNSRGDNKSKPPRLPGKKTNQRQSHSPDLTGFESELFDMDKALNK